MENTKGDASPGTIEFQDTALIDRYRKGDVQAFGLLIAKYQDQILNLIYRLCGNLSDAEELAQEVFLKAMQKIGQFRGESKFYTWLFRIAANMAISHRRHGGKIKFRPIVTGEDSQQSGTSAGNLADSREPAPWATVMNQELAQRIQQALDALDDEHRLIVVLRDVHDMDYEEIAQVLEVPLGTIKSRLHRSRLILKDKLQDMI